MRLALVVLTVLAAAPAALATHPSSSKQVRVNLDADRAREIVHRDYNVSSDHTLARASVSVSDRCAGKWIRYHVVPGRWRDELSFALGNLDGATRRPEVFAAFGNSPTEGAAAVVRYDGGGRVCARPRVLFSYSTWTTDVAPLLVSFDVVVRELDARFRGREILVRETLTSLPGRTRSRYYRYDAKGGRYLRYRQEIGIE